MSAELCPLLLHQLLSHSFSCSGLDPVLDQGIKVNIRHIHNKVQTLIQLKFTTEPLPVSDNLIIVYP